MTTQTNGMFDSVTSYMRCIWTHVSMNRQIEFGKFNNRITYSATPGSRVLVVILFLFHYDDDFFPHCTRIYVAKLSESICQKWYASLVGARAHHIGRRGKSFVQKVSC